MIEEENQKEKVKLFDVILLGNENVGKTSIFTRYTGQEFGSQVNKGIETIKKDFSVSGGGGVTIQLHDTAGMERMRSITRTYYRRAHAAILVYAVDDEQSYKDLINWEKDLREYESKTSVVSRFLVGNKTDLDEDPRIEEQNITAFCKEHDVDKSFKTSAKTGNGIEELFQHIANRLSSTTHRRWSTARTDNIKLGLQTKTYVTESSKCAC